MRRTPPNVVSCFLLIFPLIFPAISGASDTIEAGQSIRDGETIVSSSGKFELGFFSPGSSRNRYVGMWFKNIIVTTVVWVANRDLPLIDNSGMLRLIQPGILVLLNATNGTVWSSKSSRAVENPVAQLLKSGNLVVRDGNNDENDGQENFLWQSFDYPTDTYLPGMRLGWNFVTGKETSLSSWKSTDDPGTGEFSFHLDPTGHPQLLIRRGSAVQNRIGPWNRIRFPGPPNPREDPTYRLTFVMDEEKVYYRSDSVDRSFVSRYTINQSGVSQRWTWVDRTRGWVIYFSMPADICDTYKLCGSYGSCNVGSSPSCEWLDRFVPKDPEGWVRADWSNGCVRRTNLSCQGDVFLKYSGIKLPDARRSWNNAKMTLNECRQECLRNCSCTAYTQLDIKKGSGCLIWYEELIDSRTMSQDGQAIYIRMAASEAHSGGKEREVVLIASLVSVMGVILLGLSLFLCIRKIRKNDTRLGTLGKYKYHEKHPDLPFFDLSVILKATNHFSDNNKLGEGGFGPVYKGVLEEGQEITIKRLSKESRQGLDELKTELIFIAKLQHRNLVKVLGCCIQKEESMLIYEYMPNKSLDVILFDQTKSRLLDWQKRFHIINGVARGLLYLHQDSRLRIIHRDLKASNILLDSEMNPKISDFGLARSFGGNQTEAQTLHVVGTYGYMSPEYAVDGMFSVKSDVFSFGVLVLEIVSEKRNRGFSQSEYSLNLLGHAWKLYKDGRSLELVDASLDHKLYSPEVVRSIQVGLLCVQQNPEDRPTMSSVVLMLGNEGEIPQARQPGFFTERDVLAGQNSSGMNATNSTNEVTITMPEPR
ncbi:G-type lectin S-receptor-like serine/threonine-protein kinase [Sesamum alatum]|uniref:Receptor-like serine/threonine-protein kinase n=1 Tax=Sesamum alatum TaxID=300844 RepID=A0AAE1Y0Q0_9LAMI|nr:G-type lectin S-receptor-like serine/threonine-protein kinase [Sesamum alatum]